MRGHVSDLTPEGILHRLVAVPSVSALSNLPLLDVIEGILAACGWETQRLPYIASDGVEKANMLAFPARFRGALPKVELLFICHTDTVPFQSGWTNATALRENDGMLHGCGACDVKGSLAGLLAAAVSCNAEALSFPVAYAFTAEEEIGCIGATKLAASGAIWPRRVIVCEPTSLRPATAGKGYGLCQVRVTGREAHSALPASGVSAIGAAAEMIVAIGRYQRDSQAVADARFSPPHTTFNVGVVQGGTAKNIIAGECAFLVEWRPLPSEDPSHGGEVVEQLARHAEERFPGCRIEVEAMRADCGFDNDVTSGLGPALSRLLQRPETGISFGSEATRFAALADEVVVVGPGEMETAHSERECIPIKELQEWTDLVKKLLLFSLAQ